MFKWFFEKKERKTKGSRKFTCRDFPSPEMPIYVQNVDKIKEIAKRESASVEEEHLLLETISSTEKESESKGWGVAPWAYERLAILYRKRNAYESEVTVSRDLFLMPTAVKAQ